jgi:general secretion pathway protein G
MSIQQDEAVLCLAGPGVNVTRRKSASFRQRGMTLIEILIAMIVVGILASIAIPAYNNALDKADISQAVTDISSMMQAIDRYYVNNNAYPPSLADIGFAARLDPWGNAYEYLRAVDAGAGAMLRKDKILKPVNTDYDLYSKGKDGDSKLPFTAQASWDDIVRCNNGRYIGLADEY